MIFPPHSDSPHLTPPPLPSPRHHIDLTEYSVNINLYAQLHIYSYPIQDITLIRLNVNLKKTSFSGLSKLDNHISGANVIQIRWSKSMGYLTLFWTKKITKIKVCPEKKIALKWHWHQCPAGTRTRPATRYFFRYPTRFSLRKHRVAGNPKHRVLPDILGKPEVSGTTRYSGYHP